MNRIRLIAAVAVVVTLLGVSAVSLTLDVTDSRAVALPSPITTTTEPPDYSALVESAVTPTLGEEELRLTAEAVSRATTTTSTTTSTTLAPTTTTPPTTSAPTTAVESRAPSRTSPPPTTTTTTSPPSSEKAGFVSSAEGDFASRINSLRKSEGRSPLTRDGSLDSYARSWAERLAKDGGLSHSSLSALVPPWGAAGENVGMGGSVGAIFDALVASGGHRENMLGDFTHVGVGVYRDEKGVLWTAHVFTR